MGMAGRENVRLTVTTGKYEIRLKVLVCVHLCWGCDWSCRPLRAHGVHTECTHSSLMSPARSHSRHCILPFSFRVCPSPPQPDTHSAAKRGMRMFVCLRMHICLSNKTKKKKKKRKGAPTLAWVCTQQMSMCADETDCLHSPQCTFHIWWCHS